MEDMKILPCPFCGGNAELEEDTECYGHGDYAKVVRVCCVDCGGSGAAVDDRDYEAGRCISAEEQKIRAIKSWNRRVNGESDGLEAALSLFGY